MCIPFIYLVLFTATNENALMKFHQRNILHIVKTVARSWATITNKNPHVILVNFKLLQVKHLVSG